MDLPFRKKRRPVRRTSLSFTEDQLHALFEGAWYARLVVAASGDGPEMSIGLTQLEYDDFCKVLDRIEKRLNILAHLKAEPKKGQG